MANIKDVAREAGLSISTVSRVLNNRGYISDKTREKVYQVMEELNYHPNEVARNLFKKRTRIIGLIIPDISHSFFSNLTRYIEIELYSNNYKMMLCNTIEKSNREKEYLSMLQRNQVDGIIVASHTLDVEEYEKIELPVVAIDRDLGQKIPIVAADHHKGGMLAAQKIINSGCKNVAQIKAFNRVHTPSNERHNAFAKEMKKHKINCNTYELEWNKFKFDQYEKPVKKVFDENPDIDGFFSADMVAVAAIREAYKRGIKIPSQLKIVGYDGTDIAFMVNPPLTTIVQPISKIALNTVQSLIKLIEDKPIDNRYLKVDVDLIEGGTT